MALGEAKNVNANTNANGNTNADGGAVWISAALAASEAALQLLGMPLTGKDPATKAMESVCQATMAVHLRLQKAKEDVATRQSRWLETMEHEWRRYPACPSHAEAVALAIHSHEA